MAMLSAIVPEGAQAGQLPPQSLPVSVPFCTPSLQVGSLQMLLQPSTSFVLPSSHCSPAAELVIPSPQTGAVQSASQVALWPAVSQVSPAAVLVIPSPQIGAVQSASQVALWPAVSRASAAAGMAAPQP